MGCLTLVLRNEWLTALIQAKSMHALAELYGCGIRQPQGSVRYITWHTNQSRRQFVDSYIL